MDRPGGLSYWPVMVMPVRFPAESQVYWTVVPSLQDACVMRFSPSYVNVAELFGVKPEPITVSRSLEADWALPAASVAVTRSTAERLGAMSAGMIQS